MSKYKLYGDKFVWTSDNFYPNFEGNLVNVSMMRLNLEEDTYRVCVWGEDDCGFERDWKSSDPEEAKRIYFKIVNSGNVTHKLLESLKFKSA